MESTVDRLHLTSTDNPKIKLLQRLRDRRDRDLEKLFLIEGYRELLRAQEMNTPLQQLFICEELFLGSNEPELIKIFEKRKTQIISCSKKVFEKISYRDRPDGLLGIAPHFTKSLSDIETHLRSKKTPWIVIAEGIEKPGNLGTILRSCDAAGVDAMIVVDPKTDIYNPNVVRASVGTLFTVPVVQTTSQLALELCKKLHLSIAAATPHGSVSYTKANLHRPLAIVMGTEQIGLTEFWMKQADIQAVIPMQGKSDSLNVAMATTLFVFEASRQRSEHL